jgi:hypothetical protein
MGLFSNVIHVREKSQQEVCGALAASLLETSSQSGKIGPITETPPEAGEGELLYLISPQMGKWTTLIEAHFAVDGAPALAELSRSLSMNSRTHSLSLMVHDDDILFYNLSRDGKDLDGYNSNPQYFEEEPLEEDSILQQFHAPAPFIPLLPPGASLEALEDILSKGWWKSYLDGTLDEDGLAAEDEPSYVFEHERMIDVGNLLQLHGRPNGYPFAAWNGNKEVAWNGFLAARFSA